jgi:hypothetical protein
MPTVTAHGQRPAASGAHRRSCSDAAFGAALVISTSATGEDHSIMIKLAADGSLGIT